MTFRNQALPFPEDLMKALEEEFAGTRGRVQAALDALPPATTLEAALAQVQRFSKLSGKSDLERKLIAC